MYMGIITDLRTEVHIMWPEFKIRLAFNAMLVAKKRN